MLQTEHCYWLVVLPVSVLAAAAAARWLQLLLPAAAMQPELLQTPVVQWDSITSLQKMLMQAFSAVLSVQRV